MFPINNKEQNLEEDNISILSDETDLAKPTFIAALSGKISSLLSPLVSSTQYIFKGLKAFPEPSATASLVAKIVPVDDCFDLTALKNTLMLINRVLPFWDEMKVSSPEEQSAYEQGRKAFIAMEEIVAEMLNLSRPANQAQQEDCIAYEHAIKQYIQCLFFEAEAIDVEQVLKDKQLKLLLIVDFFREFLDKLSQAYLFDQDNKPIKSFLVNERANADKYCDSLTKKIATSHFYNKTETSDLASQAIGYVIFREKREHGFSSKRCTKSPTLLLSEMREYSLEFLEAILENPHNYIPIHTPQDLKMVLLDLCYARDSGGYMKLTKDPEGYTALLDSFAFSSKVVKTYFTERFNAQTINSRVLLQQKATLIALIKKEMACVLQPRIKPKPSHAYSILEIFSPAKNKVVSDDSSLTVRTGLSSGPRIS